MTCSDSIAIIRYILLKDLPALAEIEGVSRQPCWDEDDLIRCLGQPGTIGVVAELDKKIAGYSIYKFANNNICHIRSAISPAAIGQSLRVRAAENLSGILDANGIDAIADHIKSQFECPVRKVGRDEKEPPWRARNATNDSAGEPAADGENEVISKFAWCKSACDKLADLTGVMWMIVEPDALGVLVPADGTAEAPADRELYLKTCHEIANPDAAARAICSFLGRKLPRSYSNSLQEARAIVVPTGWIRPIHLESGRKGKLAYAFEDKDVSRRTSL